MCKVLLLVALVANTIFIVASVTCDGPHEFYKCWVACDNICSKYSYQNQDLCLPAVVVCQCYCDKGYARLNNGTCVPLDYCRRCKGKHEYYDCIPLCFNESCDPNPGGPICDIKTTDPVICNARCRCEDGYCRDKNGECIPKIIPLK